jgi:hypothetical protein
MLSGMTNLQAVQMIGAMFLIGMGGCIALLLIMMLAPASTAAKTEPWVAGELGVAPAYREPANPSYVDELIRIRGQAAVIYAPDPQRDEEPRKLPEPRYSRYRMPLTALIDSARPAAAEPVREYQLVGRHRLVAA